MGTLSVLLNFSVILKLLKDSLLILKYSRCLCYEDYEYTPTAQVKKKANLENVHMDFAI